MQSNEPYGTVRGVEAAIKDAAKKAAAADPSLDTNKRIQLEYFNRFLSRIFSEGEESEWVLKGGAGMTDYATTFAPATSLDLPRLTTHPYRLYPVVDQIADKVCATMNVYEGRASSREKDLVNLVVFAMTQDIDGAALTRAVDTERRRRQMDPFNAFVVPATWGPGYTKQSKTVPYCSGYGTVEAASKLTARLINPALTGEAKDAIWSHEKLSWVR